jgi:hypothetical protein
VVNAFQAARKSTKDGFVGKINPQGNALIYSTYLGGSWDDRGGDIAVDLSGNAYVTGLTSSIDFPLQNQIKPTCASLTASDAYITKFSPAGEVVYSTCHGGSGSEGAVSIAVDENGSAYVLGSTGSMDFPLVDPISTTGIGYVSKINPAGTDYIYSTQFGGERLTVFRMALDSSGSVYVTGAIDLPTFPTTEGAYDRILAGGYDAVILKIEETVSDDNDSDGFPDTEDCNDNDASIYPGAPEVCDGKDNNCDERIDEGLDADGDGRADCTDNCPTVANPEQKDLDNDGIGDVCDNCPGHTNPTQADTDYDGIGDACTAYEMQVQITKSLISASLGDKWKITVYASDPLGIQVIEIWINGDQVTTCYDTSTCDTTAPKEEAEPSVGVIVFNKNFQVSFYGDVPGISRVLRASMFNDDDGDGVLNIADNCRDVANLNQFDYDRDGVGDVCDDCDAYAICLPAVDDLNIVSTYMCSPDSSELEHGGNYYYDVFYDFIATNGCGCKDDDSGQDSIYTIGQIYLEDVTKELWYLGGQETCLGASNCVKQVKDYCLLDDTTLIEYSCSMDGFRSRQINCPLGCFGGACDRDSDGDGFIDRADMCWYTENFTNNDNDADCSLLKLDSSYWGGERWLKDPHCGNACDNCKDI